MTTPALTVANFLAAAGHGTLGTSIFMGPPRDPSPVMPHKCVFVISTGGPAPMPYIESSGDAWRETDVQIFIRGNAGEFAAGEAFAKAIFETMQFPRLTGFIDCRPMESHPVWLGFDPLDHPRWTVNVLLWSKE